jgi:hypothetical protein
MPLPPLAEVLARHTPELLAVPGVNGTGEGAEEGAPVLVVFVECRTAALAARVPAQIEGYRVVLRETGVVRPHPR